MSRYPLNLPAELRQEAASLAQPGTVFAIEQDAADYHLSVFAQKPWLSGAMYWTLQDFVCTPGWSGGNPRPDPPFHHKGLIDLAGNRKPAFGVVQAWFHATLQIKPAL